MHTTQTMNLSAMLAGTMLLIQMTVRPRQVAEMRSIPREQQKGLSISTSNGPAAFCTASTCVTINQQTITLTAALYIGYDKQVVFLTHLSIH